MEETGQDRILVVDDEEYNRDILRRRLQRQGFAVEVAEHGTMALERIDREGFDLVLLDISMPGMSGLQVLEEIRRTHSVTELPVIMATAMSDSEITVRALELGANDYVTKPLDFAVVLARIRAQLRSRKAYRSDDLSTAVSTVADPASAARQSTSLSDKVQRRRLESAPGPTAMLGQVLAGKYHIDSLIGSGAFGVVFRATHLLLKREVAVKVLLLQRAIDDRQVARFQREAVSACKLQHPAAVHVFDIDVTPHGQPFLVMELLRGHTLGQEMTQTGAMCPERCSRILFPVCDMLAEAHGAGLIHRDLKPENVFLHQEGDLEAVKVVDFGLAKLTEGDESQELTVQGHLSGTPAYVAPERWLNRPYDGKSDVYSLGVIVYAMLAGKRPFPSAQDFLGVAMLHLSSEPTPLRRERPDLSEALEQAVHRALQKNPAERSDAVGLAREFARAAGTQADLAAFRHLRV